MKIYVDANWNGTDAAPDGFDAIYKTLGDAVRGSSTSEKTVITVAGGTYDDSVAFLTDDFVISQAAKDHKRYPADVGATIESATRAGAQKADIEFVAAEGAEVKFTGNFVMGFNFSGSPDTQEWTNGVFFTGITFESASGRPNIVLSDVGDFAATDCVFNGKGEYGIDGTSNSSVTKAASVTSCTFNNSGIQAIGGVGTNMEISDCTFTESNVNATGGAENGVSITDCTFKLTLTDAHVGDSFYAVRNQSSTPVSISGCEFNIDSDLASVAADQEKWGIFYQRGNAKNWSVDSVEINLTENALAQTELLTVKNTIPGETLAIDGITSSNDVSSLLSRSEGLLNVSADGKYAMYADGVLQQEVDLSPLYVDASFSSENTGEGKIFGVNAFASVSSVISSVTDLDGKTIQLNGAADSEVPVGENVTYITADAGKNPVGNIDGQSITISGISNTTEILWFDLNENYGVADEAAATELNFDSAAVKMIKLKSGRNSVAKISNGSNLDFAEGGHNGNIYTKFNGEVYITDSTVQNIGQVSAYGAMLKLDNSELYAGSANGIKGTMEVTNGSIFSLSGAAVGEGGSLLVDGSKMVRKAILSAFDDSNQFVLDWTANRDLPRYRVCIGAYQGSKITGTGTMTVSNGAVFDFSSAYAENEYKDIAEANTTEGIVTVSEGSTLNIEDSTFCVDNLVSNGTVRVAGDSTLKIASLNGSLLLNDEAVLSSDTSIAGDGSIMGGVTVVAEDADITSGGIYDNIAFSVTGILNFTGVNLSETFTVGTGSTVALDANGVLAFNNSNVIEAEGNDAILGTILNNDKLYDVTANGSEGKYASFSFAESASDYEAIAGSVTASQKEDTYTFTYDFASNGGSGDVIYEFVNISVADKVLEEGTDYEMEGNSFTLKNNGPADLVITVEAEDQYGEASKKEFSVTLAVKDYTDPVFASALTPDTTEQAESVTFVASEVSDNFGVVSYTYTFNGETKEWKAGESVTVTENGLFTVQASDAAGNIATQTYDVTNIVIPEVPVVPEEPVIPEEPVVPDAPSGPANILVVTPGNSHEYHGEDVVMPEGQSIAAILNTKSEAMNLEVGVLGKAGEGVTDLMLGYGVNMEIQKEFQNPGNINVGFNSSLKVEGDVVAEGSFKSLIVGGSSSVEVNGDVANYGILSAGANGSFVAENVSGTTSGMDLFSAGYGAEVDVKDIAGVENVIFGGSNDVYAGDISGVRNMILGYGSELDAGTVSFEGNYSMLALAGNNFVAVEELDGLKNLLVGYGSKIEFAYNGEEDLDLSGIAGNWDFAELEDCRGVLAGGSVEGATYGNELDTFVASGSLSFEFDSESTKVMYAAWNEAEEDYSDWTVLESGSTLADGDYLIGAASLDGKGKTKGNYSFDVTIA